MGRLDWNCGQETVADDVRGPNERTKRAHEINVVVAGDKRETIWGLDMSISRIVDSGV